MAIQANLRNDFSESGFFVVHPLFDKPEQKCDPNGLGKIEMSKSVRMSLIVLRAYLLVMGVILSYHMLDLAGAFGHHAIR